MVFIGFRVCTVVSGGCHVSDVGTLNGETQLILETVVDCSDCMVAKVFMLCQNISCQNIICVRILPDVVSHHRPRNEVNASVGDWSGV